MARRTVEADNAEQARARLGVRPSRVAALRPDIFGAVRNALAKVRINAYDQATLISSLSAAALSGQASERVFTRMMQSKRGLRHRISEVLAHDKISDRLKALNFDRQVVLMTQAGEQSGDLGQAMRAAARNIIYRKKIIGGLKSAMALPGITVGAAVLALVILPMFFVPLLEEFRKSGIAMEQNVATTITVIISTLVRDFWFLGIAALIAVYVARRALWARFRHVGPFQTIDDYTKCLRALSFMAVFQPLYSRGVPIEAILNHQARGGTRGQRAVYQRLLDASVKGHAFSESLSERDWPETMISGLNGFEASAPDAKDMMLVNVVDLMTDRVDVVSGRITRIAQLAGIALGGATFMMLAFGVYYPLFTATSAGL